ncbi:MAG: hypothetical protein NTZ03_13560 [Actinobacteria bacterium]|nr:hypothetical protein [Actinomycetota bacterium]
MCCAALVLGFLGPRLAFLWIWIFNLKPVEAAMGGSFWVALLGLIFLPWTSLMYVICWAQPGGVSGIGWLFVALGFFFDIATWSGRLAQNRYQGSATSGTA